MTEDEFRAEYLRLAGCSADQLAAHQPHRATPLSAQRRFSECLSARLAGGGDFVAPAAIGNDPIDELDISFDCVDGRWE